MKKTSLLVLVASCTLLFCGCNSSNETQALHQLSTQLESTTKTIESTSTLEVAEVSPNTTFDANSTFSSFQRYKTTSYQNMMKEESLRQDILSLSSTIKSCTEKEYKLSKPQIKAIVSLSNNIAKYTNHINETKPYIKSSVKKIKNATKSTENIKLDEAECFYITLNNSMNERYAYMSNIYSNLEQIYNILDCCQNCCDDSSQNYVAEQKTTETSFPDKQDQPISKNIDTFTNTAKDIPHEQEPIYGSPSHVPNRPDAYNRYLGRGPFNPNRNTDSFYPRIRNIDTYRFNPNNYYNEYYNNSFYNGNYNQNIGPI